MQEIEFGRQVWTYFDAATVTIDAKTGKKVRHEVDSEGSSSTDRDAMETNSLGTSHQSDSSEMQIRTWGTTIQVFENEEDDMKPAFQFVTSSRTMENCSWNTDLITFLNDLQNLVNPYIMERFLPIKTDHQRGKTIFRGHPNYRGHPWKDWVLVDWGTGYGTLPSHIWCFVTLKNMPTGRETLQYGGIKLTDGVYAVVETANYAKNQDGATDLFTPLELDVEGIDADGVVTGRRFYLANTEAFVGTCCVVPDIGGKSNCYYQVKARAEWTNLFITWLKAPHDQDVMELSEEEEDSNSD